MTVTRVHYAERQVLSANDLNDEQTYLVESQRRHLVLQHQWGIVQGLGLQVVPTGFVVQPGYAVDGHGQELIVTRPIFRPWATGDGSEVFDHIGGGEVATGDGDRTKRFLDVWLLSGHSMDLDGRNQPGCVPSSDHQDGIARVCLTAGASDEGVGKPCDPAPDSARMRWPAVADDPIDGGLPAWPVFLGRLVRSATTDSLYSVDHTCRRYAGLVGAEIASASTVAPLEDPAHPPLAKPEPVRSAAVELTERVDGERRVTVWVSDDKGTRTDRISIDTLRGASIRAKTTMGDPDESTEVEDPRDAAVDLYIDCVDPTFKGSDIRDPDALRCALEKTSSRRMVSRASAKWRDADAIDSFDDALADVRSRLSIVDRTRAFQTDPRERMADALNDLLGDPAFEVRRFTGLPLRATTRRLITDASGDAERVVAKRALLEDLFSDAITPLVEVPAAHGVEFRPAPAPPGDPPPPVPAPWRIYRAEVKRDDRKVRQLRIEIGTSGDPRHPERSQFTVGSASGTGKDYLFSQCLSVDEACRVRVGGDMTVAGEVIMKPLPVAPEDLGVNEPGAIEEQTLTVGILVAGPDWTDNAWPYVVLVTNAGSSSVRSVSLYEIVGVGGQASPTRKVGSPFDLAAGQARSVSISHPSGLPGASNVDVGLSVTAVGLGSANVMYASGQRTVHRP